jgi:hypothetical protein
MYVVLVGHDHESVEVVGPFDSLDDACGYQIKMLNFDVADILEVKAP